MIALILAGMILTGKASYYGVEACKYNPDPKCPMANGESLYDVEAKGEKYAAMWNVPFGTKVKVCNERSKLCTECVIKDRGPAPRLGRLIDLSRLSFGEIADPKEGVINVTAEVIA